MANTTYIKAQIRKNMPKVNIRGKAPSTNTLTQHLKHSSKYAEWVKANYKCRTFEACGTHIQDYCDYLVAEGKSPSTIHTYVAACCYTWQVPLADIKKPARHTHTNTRSRGIKAVDKRSDAQRDASPRLFDFAEMVGVRRHEYLAMRQDDVMRDESGALCVYVRKGKGGKKQLQRILPQHEEAVLAYFDGSNNFVFTKAEMKNKLDLHHIRAEVAQNAYRYYENRLSSDENYRAQLTAELKARWERYNKKNPWDDRCVRGNYNIRGGNRKLAKKHGLPTSYDRLIVMAVSVFHLSHWRCDVTVDNYLLAF
ncbi:hypothetical protein RFF05_09450 [Bengtsoniella intestinalis]|uniref:hypothetical protein n=1 Tax=Bengtsoniella intestinalis TaxID=3073143 RepID=UPI00391EEE71